MVTVSNLTVRYGAFEAIKNVNLSLHAGKIYAILGPNGAGKTTLIKAIAGLIKPAEGEIVFWDKNPLKFNRSERLRIGYEPQELGLYEELSILNNMVFYSKICKVKDRKNRIEELLSVLDLTEYKNKKIGKLSGGMKKKVSFSIALLHEPTVLFLDEPVAGIDPILRRNIFDYLANYVSDDRLIVISTHQFDEAEKTDELIFLREGSIIHSESTQSIRAASVTVEQRFIEKLDR